MSHESFTALKIPLTKCGSFLRKLAPHIHSDTSTPSIVPDQQKSSRLLLLNQSIVSKDLKGLPEDLKTWIREQNDVSVVDYTLDKAGPLLKRNKSILIEADPVAEVLPKDVDSNVRKEVLKHVIILKLQREQMPYVKEIAKLLLERGEGETKSVVVRVDDRKGLANGLGDYFACQRYELAAGEGDTTIEIEEDKCHFTFELTKCFYDSSLQAERDRVFAYFDQKDVVCDLFPNMFLALRMAKLGLKVIVNTHNDASAKEIILKNMVKNGIDETNVGVLSCDTLGFLKTCLKSPFKDSKDCVRHIYISLFLEDLAFLRIFVGLGNVFEFHESFKEEKNLPCVYFYYILDVKTVKTKFKEQVIKSLNPNKDVKIFDQEDLEDIKILNEFSGDSSKRVFMIKLKLSQKVIYSPTPLIYEVLGMEENKNGGKMLSVGKRSASKELKALADKEVEKDVSDRRTPSKKSSGTTPSKMVHTDKN